MKYELVDISISENLLQEMRDKTGNSDAIPPQIFNGEKYCGVRNIPQWLKAMNMNEIRPKAHLRKHLIVAHQKPNLERGAILHTRW